MQGCTRAKAGNALQAQAQAGSASVLPSNTILRVQVDTMLQGALIAKAMHKLMLSTDHYMLIRSMRYSVASVAR